jgi:mannose-6-phosphate isomerase-like protein (cupin superfamily)
MCLHGKSDCSPEKAKFVCKKCGAFSKKEEHLCKSEKMKKEETDECKARWIESPTLLQAAGTPPKTIEEFFGRVNTEDKQVSIARMHSPSGWSEPGQTPKFDEYTVVLQGCLHLQFKETEMDVRAGQAVMVPQGEWVRYSTPKTEGAEYIAVCLPAFSPKLARRDTEEPTA